MGKTGFKPVIFFVSARRGVTPRLLTGGTAAAQRALDEGRQKCRE
jgi:ribosomal protein S18